MTPRRILIVDNEETVARGIHAGLRKLPDCEVSVACRGGEALRLARERPFDLLITDYQIGETDGLLLAQDVRQVCPSIVIVLVTSIVCDALYQRAQACRVQCVLEKPVPLSKIRRVAMGALGRSGG